MKKGSVLIGALLMLAAQIASAQAPTSPDTTAVVPTTPPPVAAPPPPPPPPPPPSPTPSAASAYYKFGGISGGWLTPTGDFEKAAGGGWAIIVEGYQFITPTKKIAIGSQVGYQSFGKKNGVTVSNFPVDALLRFYPKPGAGKVDLFGTGGMGFNYLRTDVGNASNSEYCFGTQAGVGAELHTGGAASLIVDAVYHWIYAPGTDPNFLALRGGIVIPMMR